MTYLQIREENTAKLKLLLSGYRRLVSRCFVQTNVKIRDNRKNAREAAEMYNRSDNLQLLWCRTGLDVSLSRVSQKGFRKDQHRN